MQRIALLSVQGFVALTSFVGGLAMVLASWLGPERLGIPPEMSMPAELLEGSPFGSYLVPGLLLALVVGGLHVLAFILVARRRRWAEFASAAAGYSILVWIFVQMIFIPFSVLQAVYFAAGLAELGFLLLTLGLFPAPAGRTSASARGNITAARTTPATGV